MKNIEPKVFVMISFHSGTIQKNTYFQWILFPGNLRVWFGPHEKRGLIYVCDGGVFFLRIFSIAM